VDEQTHQGYGDYPSAHNVIDKRRNSMDLDHPLATDSDEEH